MMLSVVSRVLAVAAVSLQVTAIMAAPSRRRLQGSAAQSIVELVTSDPDLTKLAGALKLASNADLLETLSSGSDFTVLAPTDAAFAALELTPVGTRVLTKAGYASHLFNLLGLHVNVGTVVLAAELVTGKSLTMANDEMVTVGDGPTFAGPSNNATAAAKVLAADILASNGVIHKIDTVLLPDFWILDAVTLAETAEVGTLATLKELFLKVKDDPSSSAILGAAKSVEVTIFAPTDEAFAELGEKAIATILANPTLLFNILQNHVYLAGVLGYDDLTDGLKVATLRNGPLTVSRKVVSGEEKVFLGETLVMESILANNGIIHSIENVLLSADDRAILFPNATTPTAAPVMTGGPPVTGNAVTPAPVGTNTTTTSTAPVADAPVAAPTNAPELPPTTVNTTSQMPVTMPTTTMTGAAKTPSLAPARPPSPPASSTTTLVGSSSLVSAMAAMLTTTLLMAVLAH